MFCKVPSQKLEDVGKPLSQENENLICKDPKAENEKKNVQKILSQKSESYSEILGQRMRNNYKTRSQEHEKYSVKV